MFTPQLENFKDLKLVEELYEIIITNKKFNY